jgi:hypothetical protein
MIAAETWHAAWTSSASISNPHRIYFGGLTIAPTNGAACYGPPAFNSFSVGSGVCSCDGHARRAQRLTAGYERRLEERSV